jgi:hypothetical protein
MRNKITLSIILIFIQIFPQTIYAESDTLTSVIQKFNRYQEQNYQEKIYVRLDKSYYLSGEFLRFKVYCLDAKTQYSSPLSKVAYLELLDSNHTAVIQTKILLEEGKGYGEVFIPSNFNSGNYLLRSYTRWMNNLRADLYYQSIVHIINPFKKPGLRPKTKEIDIQFIPEGGTLVNGIKSKIAFKVTNAYGHGIDFAGSIIDDLGNIVLQFSPIKYGIGSFNFLPDKNRSYRAVVFLEDSSEINPRLPNIKNEGLVLRIDNINPDEINIEVISNHSSFAENVFLIGQTDNKIQFAKKINISNGTGTASIKKENIDPGIIQITLFNSSGIPINERLVFVYPKINVDLQISTEKKVFQHREKVTVKIFTSDENHKPINMDLSISVSSHDKYFDKYSHDIKEYLFLNGEVQGNIEDPDYYLDGQSEKGRQAMDNLMLTHRYKGFLWEDMNTDNNQKVFIPEYRTHIVTGTLTNETSQVPEEGIYTYLSIPSKNARFFATKSQKDGKLLFEISDFVGENEIILQTNNTIDTNYQITVDNPFSEKYSDFCIPFFDIDDSMKYFIEKASKNMQIQNAYLKYRPPSSIISEVDSSTFYDPDAKYFLDDYIRFPVMEEVMREYVSGVYLRSNQEGFHFKILDLDRTETYQENPLILLDGIPIFDADEIIELDPLKIKKIETVRKRFLKGVLNCSGIVSFSTYNGDLDGYQLNKKALVVEYDGVQPLKEYSTPTYDIITEENIRMPDYRNVLYWNPQFETDENGEAILEFYTSDDASVYEIRVEGLSSNGRPVFNNSFIEVTDNND